MKRMTFLRKNMFKSIGVALTMGVSATFAGCSEDINEGDYAIAKMQTVSDYLKSQPQFSDICAIFDRVKLGNSADASSLTSVMSARGHYTVFAPNNEAVEKYMKGVGVNSLSELSDEDAVIIAKNCIIDNGSNAAYESADFPVPGAFTMTNLNDRILTCSMDTIGTDYLYVINGTSPVVKADVELSNGMVHEVNTVISPSADDLGKRIADADNLKIFSRLLMETSWADSITDYLDMEYEKRGYQDVSDYRLASEPNHVIHQLTHRYNGYTALVEPDSVYAQKWGLNITLDADGEISNWEQILPVIRQKCAQYYTNASDDLKNVDNAVNQFVAYHIGHGSMAYDKLVNHSNEFGYKWGSSVKNPQTVNCPVDVWNYLTTLGKHAGLIKIVQSGDSGPLGDSDHHIYANRICSYDNTTQGDYHVTGVQQRGILISSDNGKNDNNAQNGFYYPIDDILLYDTNTRDLLGSERIRIDVYSILHEASSNTMRGRDYLLLPNDFFENLVNVSNETKIVYDQDQYGSSWRVYQGDEFNISGLYDFTIKLPPVPVDGTYEIRLGVSNNAMRGMSQPYFGTNPNKLAPVGLPIDMRQPVVESNPEIPWVADGDDEDANRENDKNLRNHGYMKGPQYITVMNGNGDTPIRGVGGTQGVIRRIITETTMSSDKRYYVRFKSALKKMDSQFTFDYFEIVPKKVYNGAVAEDIW